jgi:hypothetical protein
MIFGTTLEPLKSHKICIKFVKWTDPLLDRCCILYIVLAGCNYIEVWEISVAGYLLSWYISEEEVGISVTDYLRLIVKWCVLIAYQYLEQLVGVSKSVADGRVYKPTDAQLWLKYIRGVDSIYERMPTKGAFYYW